MHRISLLALAATAACTSLATAQPSQYFYVGVLGGQGQEVSTPAGIAPGPVVYGTNNYYRNSGNFRRAFIWTPATGMDPLSGTPASGTSSGVYAMTPDGRTIVGVLGIAPGSSGVSPVVFKRVDNSPDQTLPLAAGMFYPEVGGISDNGLVTVGSVNGYGGGGTAVRWIGTDVASVLPTLPSAPSAQAYGANADGSIIVGWSGRGYPLDNVPVRWVNGQVESLGLPPGCSWAWARAVSRDGSTIIGLGWATGGATRAFKWTAQTGMTLLPSASQFSEASSISADGRLIGGHDGSESTVWRDGVAHSVQHELLPAGTSIVPFSALSGNAILSRDGHFVASTDRVAQGAGDAEYQVWAATLPGWFAVCAADFNSDGALDFFDYLDFVDSFSMNSASADFNGDSVIDFFDYLDFVDAFSSGC